MFSYSQLKNTAMLLAGKNGFPLTVIREDSDLSAGYVVHRHDAYELRIVLTPQLRQVQRLDLILPRVCHESLPADENARAITILFCGSFFHFRYLNAETLPLRSIYAAPMQELLRQAAAADALELKLTLALFLLKAEPVRASGQVSERLDTVIRCMEQHYYRPDLSISTLAEMAGYSPNYLQKVFRAAVGCNPKEYLLKIRMDTAAKILREKQYLVKEIAILCGFSDPHYFANVFREYYGCSPRDFLRVDPGSSPAKRKRSA
ncbi:MAG: helix-turn-helix transcriptional regulator [Lentisphaeria bacterium]|nr:helix-turn-helix transcriptional regulator [Lentisphaeria bacterium]